MAWPTVLVCAAAWDPLCATAESHTISSISPPSNRSSYSQAQVAQAQHDKRTPPNITSAVPPTVEEHSHAPHHTPSMVFPSIAARAKTQMRIRGHRPRHFIGPQVKPPPQPYRFRTSGATLGRKPFLAPIFPLSASSPPVSIMSAMPHQGYAYERMNDTSRIVLRGGN